MQYFIHFIGRKYYPAPADFAAEACKYGVTRRLPLNSLKAMEFGDVVHCAMRIDGEAHIFGYFIIGTISGLSPEAVEALREKYGDRVGEEDPEAEPEQVKRGCGSYLAGAPIRVDLTMAQIAEVLMAIPNPGKAMVGGTFYSVLNPGRIKGLKHFQGFKRFNYDAYLDRLHAEMNQGRPPIVDWDFNGDDAGRDPKPEGEIQPVHNYKRKEEEISAKQVKM